MAQAHPGSPGASPCEDEGIQASFPGALHTSRSSLCFQHSLKVRALHPLGASLLPAERRFLSAKETETTFTEPDGAGRNFTD